MEEKTPVQQPENAFEGYEKIEKFEALKKYFDVTNLDDDGMPSIVIEQKTVIIVDNETWNETYIIDIMNEIREDYPHLGEEHTAVKFLYIDDFDTKKMLLAPSRVIEENVSKEAFEKTYLTPCVFVINPLTNEFHHFTEPLGPLNKPMIIKALEMSKILE